MFRFADVGISDGVTSAVETGRETGRVLGAGTAEVVHATAPTASSSSMVACRGFIVPEFNGKPALLFPMERFMVDDAFKRVTLQMQRSCLVARANSCNGFAAESYGICSECIAARLDHIDWHTLAKRANESVIGSTLPWGYYNHGQFRAAMTQKCSEIEDYRLTIFNLRKKLLNSLDEKATMGHILQLIATGDVKRVHAYISQSLKRGESPHKLLERLSQASIGAVRARGFSASEYDAAKLLLRAGGERVLHAVSVELHLPSVSTIRRSARQLHRFVPTTHYATLHKDVMANVTAYYDKVSQLQETASNPTELFILVFAVDETKLREAVRFHHRTNRLLGLCVEHAYDFGTSSAFEVADVDTVSRVHAAVASGELHVAAYVSLWMLKIASHEGYNWPIAAISSCLKRGALLQRLIADTVLAAAVKRLSSGISDHSIRILATDGDPRRRVSGHSLFYTKEVRNTVDGVVVKGLDLPSPRGEHGYDLIVFDWLHMGKRVRNTILRKLGMKANGIVFDAILCDKILRKLGCDDAEIASLLNESDKMNVSSAITLLRHLYKASQTAASELDANSNKPVDEQRQGQNEQQNLGLALLGIVIRPYLAVILPGEYVQAGPSDPLQSSIVLLQAQLKWFAASAVATAVLFHQGHSKSETNFLPSVLFHDILQNAMMVLQLGCKCVDFLRGGTSDNPRQVTVGLGVCDTNGCEDAFSHVRGSVYDPNCDALQFAQRLASVIDITALFDKHPHWKRYHRRSLDSSGDGITLQRLKEHLQKHGIKATLSISDVDVKSNRFAPVAAWHEGEDLVFQLLKRQRRHLVEPDTVFVRDGSDTLAVLELPSLMRRNDNSFIGVKHSPVNPMDGGNDNDKILASEETELQHNKEAESSFVAPTSGTPQREDDGGCIDLVLELDDIDSSGSALTAPVSTFCEVNGKLVSKNNLVNTMFNDFQSRGAPADRLLRFRTPPTTSSLQLETFDSGDGAVLVADGSPVVALLLKAVPNQVKVTLARVAQIQIVNKHKPTIVPSLNTAHLHDDRVQLRVSPLPVITGIASSAPRSVSMDTRILQFSSGVTSADFTVSGSTVQLVDLSSGEVQYSDATISISASMLTSLADGIWAGLISTSGDTSTAGAKAVKKIMQAGKVTASMFDSCVIAPAAHQFLMGTRLIACSYPKCHIKRKSTTLRLHIAYHMLQLADSRNASIDTLCGFCGSTQQMHNGSCALVVLGGVVTSNCKHAGTADTKHEGFGQRKPNRCTNDLTKCPQPECATPLFRYCLPWHLSSVHQIDVAEPLATPAERKLVEDANGNNNAPSLAAATLSGTKRPSAALESDAAPAGLPVDADAATGASSRAPPVNQREYHVFEWDIYVNTDAYVRELDILLRHVTERHDSQAKAKLDAIIAKLKDTGDTLRAARDKLIGTAMDDALGCDVGLDTATQYESLTLHIKMHEQAAADLEKKSNLDEWRRQLASEPRETRKTTASRR